MDEPPADRRGPPERDLPDRALELMDEVDSERATSDLASTADRDWGKRAVGVLLAALSDADADAARRRVAKLRQRHPEADADALVERIVARACRRTAAVGAASSSAAIVPGLGTVAALTAGVAADLTATFKLQAEMVLEIADACGFPLDTLETQQIVFLMTGVSTGGTMLAGRVGRELGTRVTERAARKWLSHALPVIGIVTASGTNAFATYVIGRRAHAYFRDGPDAVRDWRDSVRRLSGLDERRFAAWLAEGGARTLEAGRSVGGTAADAARAVGGGATSAVRAVGGTAGGAARAVGGAAASLADAVRGGVRTLGGRFRRGGDAAGESVSELPGPSAEGPAVDPADAPDGPAPADDADRPG